MKMNVIAGSFLILAGLASIGYGAIKSAAHVKRAGELQTKLENLQADRDSINTVLFDKNMRYRAHREGMKSMPDTLRLAQAGPLMKRSEEYNKQLRSLELNQTEASRQIRRRQRQKAESLAIVKRRAVPFGVGGILALVFGMVLVARGRDR